MVRALDITDEPVTAPVVEPETEPEESFDSNEVINSLRNMLPTRSSPATSPDRMGAIIQCFQFLADRVDDLRGENHRLRKRLSAVSSLSEYVHQNLQYTKFRAAIAGTSADPPDRLLLHIAERLDKIAQREFVPGRAVTKMMCDRCGEVANEGCKSCEGVTPNGNGRTWRDVLWEEREVPLNAKTED